MNAEASLSSTDAASRTRIAASFLFFALLLAAYYLLRPVRDSLAAGLGSGAIKYLSTAVLVASGVVAALYGWLVARLPRRRLVPILYAAFALKALGFAVLFTLVPDSRWVAQCFYIWLAVFNLLMVASFWSFMADLWQAQGTRHFARIAAGGSAGGMLGPLIARHYATSWGTAGLTVAAAVLLGLCALLAIGLMVGTDAQSRLRFNEPIGGSAFAGLRLVAESPYLRAIALLVAAGSFIGMFVYIEVAHAAAALFPDTTERTTYFASRDLWVNGLSLAIQWFVAPKLMRRWGVAVALIVVAGVVGALFGALMIWPSAALLLAINVTTRTLEFGVGKPCRDVLYTAVDTESKYKAKNVIDTVFYRACDTTAGWLHALLTGLGAGLPVLGGLAVFMAGGMASVGLALGQRFKAQTRV